MPQSLVSAWERVVREAPNRVALVECATGRRWTRSDLAESAAEWTRELPAGIPLRGRRVLMVEPNGPRWLSAFVGLLQAGAIPAAADSSDPAPVHRLTAERIGASWLWSDNRLAPVPGRRAARNQHACLVKITSGSTGVPKALAFTDSQMIADGRQICGTMGITADDVNLAVIPFGHSYGLGNLVVPLLVQGTAIACASGPFPQAIANDSGQFRPTVFPAVPMLLRGLLRSAVDPRQLATLRLVISAGSPLAPDIAAAFSRLIGRPVHGFYGSSETGGITYDRTGDATLTGRSVGTPLAGVTLQFRSNGRFVVDSPAVFGRGRHMPQDLARIDPNGELVLLGRIGRTVKVAGRRINLSEIETALSRVPGIRAACAIERPGQHDHIAAVVETELTPLAVRTRLLATMAAWKIPDVLVAVAQLPMTARGKVDRRRAALLVEGRRPAR